MDEADFIIVGAGSAGSALAAGLSADGRNRVLLLEAGGPGRHPWLRIPIGYGKVFYDARFNWKYMTEPDPNLNGRRMYWPRGKVLGGSSAINAMVYVRGHPADYAEWDTVAPGWGWADVEPTFRQIECWQGPASAHRGAEGPLSITDVSAAMHPLSHAFVAAAAQAGIPTNPDYNATSMAGASFYQITTRDGLRASAADAFLRPVAKRANLAIVTDALATGIQFEGRRATGVSYLRHGKRLTARATREVILCGGAINTPQLLQLSGIGPGGLLQAQGIPVVQDTPEVGRNLMDHLCTDLHYAALRPSLNQTLRPLWGKAMVAAQYLLTRRGPLAMSLNQAGGFIRTQAGDGPPDQQLYFSPLSYETAPAGKRPLLSPDPFPAYRIGFNPCKPTSRGHLEIRSPDPRQAPALHPNYLATEEDRALAIEGTRLMRKIASMPALADLSERELQPGPDIDSDDEILAFFRDSCSTVFHQCGTCRMAANPDGAVVDARLKVHAIAGLRVADASVFPTIPSGNTNAPSIMLGARAADMIREDFSQERTP